MRPFLHQNIAVSQKLVARLSLLGTWHIGGPVVVSLMLHTTASLPDSFDEKVARALTIPNRQELRSYSYAFTPPNEEGSVRVIEVVCDSIQAPKAMLKSIARKVKKVIEQHEARSRKQ